MQVARGQMVNALVPLYSVHRTTTMLYCAAMLVAIGHHQQMNALAFPINAAFSPSRPTVEMFMDALGPVDHVRETHQRPVTHIPRKQPVN